MRIVGKKKAIRNATIRQEELARRIAKAIVSAQTDLAGYLNTGTNRLSQKEKLTLLVAFITLFAAWNIYIML